jgi:hypothetical protein
MREKTIFIGLGAEVIISERSWALRSKAMRIYGVSHGDEMNVSVCRSNRCSVSPRSFGGAPVISAGAPGATCRYAVRRTRRTARLHNLPSGISYLASHCIKIKELNKKIADQLSQGTNWLLFKYSSIKQI